MTIVDRVVERLKLQPIGDLITEEDLHDIVKEAIPRVFFTPRKIPGKGYGDRETEEPPYIVQIMKELLRESATECMKTYLEENKDVLLEFWKKVLDDGIMNYVQKLEELKAKTHVADMLRPLIDTLNDERRRSGLTPFFM